MANAQGENAGESGQPEPRLFPPEAAATAWSGNSTPPNVYGTYFSQPNLSDDFMDAMAQEPTVEDTGGPNDMRTAHTVRQKVLSHVQELEESGEYDMRALAPLRHLLDQDWTDPNVRSRLKAKVEAEDAKMVAPAGNGAPAKQWFAGITEEAAQAETLQVPTLPPSAPVGPPPAQASTPETWVAGTWPTVGAQSSQSQTSVEQATAIAKPPVSAPRSASASVAKPALKATAVAQTDFGSSDLVFDDEGGGGQKKRQANAARTLAKSLPKAPDKRFVRPWMLAAGALVVAGAWAMPASLYSDPPVAPAPLRFLLNSQPKAEIHRGSEILGETPMVLEASQVGDGLQLTHPGYQSQTFTLTAPLADGKVEKREVVLQVAPVSLDWTGLPPGASLSWNGKPSSTEALATSMPGSYTLKVESPLRPSVELSVVVPAPGGADSVTTLAVGKQLEQALARQPALSMSLKPGKGKAPKLPLAVTVKQTDKGKSFSETTSLDGKTASKLSLPGPGTYQIKVPASATHLAFSKTLTFKEGASQNLQIALSPVPPKAAPSPVASSHSGGGGYVPEPTYYAPAPTYYGGGGGGGGGGGRIAPPSF